MITTGSALGSRPGMRLRLTVTSSHIAITEPVGDLLEEIGWTGGECITDSRAMVHYFRTTPDGRIAFGWGGGRVVLGARTGGRAERDPDVIAELERHMLRFFPGLAGRRVEQAWGGPIDVSPSHLPVIVPLGPQVHCAFGYTGHGVGPSHMLGRSLASLALGIDDEPSRLALVNPPALRVPPGAVPLPRRLAHPARDPPPGVGDGARRRPRPADVGAGRDPGAHRDPHRAVGQRLRRPPWQAVVAGGDAIRVWQ